MSKLRVLHVIPSLQKGGAERLTLDICKALNDSGEAVSLLVSLSPVNHYSDEYNQDIKYCNSKVIPSLSSKPKIEISEFEEIVNNFKPDIIHTHLFEAEITARELFYPQAAWFSHLHDNMFQFKNMKFADWISKRRLTEFYEKLWMIKRYKRCKNAFIAISKDAEIYFRKTLPKHLQNITLLSNAIDYSKFDSEHLVLPDSRFISMVSIGSLVDKKNQIFLIDVVLELNKLQYKAKLDILGDGINRKMLEEKISRNNLNDQITLHGNVSYVEEYLKKASFYVHPAYYEPFGLVLLEAMAASKVCVALNGRGNLDIHEEGRNGFVIDPADAKSFAKKLIELSENPQKYKEVANYSHQYAKAFDIKGYASKLLSIYRNRRAELKLDEINF